MKRSDDILTRLIKEAFNKYKADHLADEAWEAFMKKTGKKGAGILIPLWAKAASLALLITGAGIIVHNSFFSKKALIKEIPVMAEQKTEDREAINRDISVIDVKEKERQPGIVGNRPDPILSSGSSLIEEQPGKEPEKPDYSTIEKLPVLVSGIKLLNYNELIEDRARRTAMTSFYDPLPENYLAGEKRKTGLLAGLSGMMARLDDNKSSDPGSSMGVYLERKLSKRISVRPGLAFALQSYNLDNSSALRENKVYTAPAMDGASVAVQNYDAQLNSMALELPVNLVFTIWELSLIHI